MSEVRATGRKQELKEKAGSEEESTESINGAS